MVIFAFIVGLILGATSCIASIAVWLLRALTRDRGLRNDLNEVMNIMDEYSDNESKGL